MKTKEELNALKAEFDVINKKLAELSEDELSEVGGGVGGNGVILVTGKKPESVCGIGPEGYDCSGVVSIQANEGDFIQGTPFVSGKND